MDNNINTPNLSNDNVNNVPNLNNNMSNMNNSNMNNPFNQMVNDSGYVASNYNINNNSNNKKNNTSITIIICLVVITVFVFGAYGVFKVFTTAADKVINDIEEDVLPEDEFKLYNFSKYKNYKFTMDISVVMDGVEIKTFSKGDADVEHKTDYMETTITVSGYNKTSYSYSDYKSGYSYTSDDNKNWVIGTVDGEESINLKDLIDKINNNTDVTKLGSDHYSVKLDYNSGGTTYDNVYADVYTAYGYISSISYDFTDLVSDEGISKFTVSMKIDSVNRNVDIVIPDNVKKGTSSI